MKGWGKPMLEYFEAVYGLMVQHAKTLVNVHFGLHMHSGLHSTVMCVAYILCLQAYSDANYTGGSSVNSSES